MVLTSMLKISFKGVWRRPPQNVAVTVIGENSYQGDFEILIVNVSIS